MARKGISSAAMIAFLRPATVVTNSHPVTFGQRDPG